MRPTNTKENDMAGNSITKTESENEGNFTLPDSLSNASQRGLLDGSVMWAEPKTLGLGTRSGGPGESPNARTVTKGVAAGQTRPVGAVLVVGEPKRQAMPVANNGTSSKQSVIDEKHENEADPWTKWRRKYATEVYVPKPLTSVFRDEAATLGREEAFAIVKAARSILNEELQARQSRRDTPASQQTLADYAKKCLQIDMEVGDVDASGPKPLLQVMSRYAARKQTFSVMKTALKWRGLERLRALLRAQDLLQREQPDSLSWRTLLIELKHAVSELEAVQSLKRQDGMELAGTNTKPSRSKKFLLPRLPPGWQERFLDANRSSEKYRMAGVLLRHCGMRPKELAIGVILTACDQGVVVHIAGAKVRETAGQPWRTFTLKAGHIPEWFVREVREKRELVVRADEDPLRAHLGRLSDHVFYPDGKGASRSSKSRLKLSAYVFRHALVTEMREDGWETQNIAAVIGESSADTVRLYGIRVRTRTKSPKVLAIDVKSVQAARPVRAVDSSGLNAVLNYQAKLRSEATPRKR